MKDGPPRLAQPLATCLCVALCEPAVRRRLQEAPAAAARRQLLRGCVSLLGRTQVAPRAKGFVLAALLCSLGPPWIVLATEVKLFAALERAAEPPPPPVDASSSAAHAQRCDLLARTVAVAARCLAAQRPTLLRILHPSGGGVAGVGVGAPSDGASYLAALAALSTCAPLRAAAADSLALASAARLLHAVLPTLHAPTPAAPNPTDPAASDPAAFTQSTTRAAAAASAAAAAAGRAISILEAVAAEEDFVKASPPHALLADAAVLPALASLLTAPSAAALRPAALRVVSTLVTLVVAPRAAAADRASSADPFDVAPVDVRRQALLPVASPPSSARAPPQPAAPAAPRRPTAAARVDAASAHGALILLARLAARGDAVRQPLAAAVDALALAPLLPPPILDLARRGGGAAAAASALLPVVRLVADRPLRAFATGLVPLFEAFLAPSALPSPPQREAVLDAMYVSRSTLCSHSPPPPPTATARRPTTARRAARRRGWCATWRRCSSRRARCCDFLADAEPRVAEKAAHVLERASAAPERRRAARERPRLPRRRRARRARHALQLRRPRRRPATRAQGAPVAAARRPRRVQGGARPAPRARAEDARRRRRRLAGAPSRSLMTAGEVDNSKKLLICEALRQSRRRTWRRGGSPYRDSSTA